VLEINTSTDDEEEEKKESCEVCEEFFNCLQRTAASQAQAQAQVGSVGLASLCRICCHCHLMQSSCLFPLLHGLFFSNTVAKIPSSLLRLIMLKSSC
jgi:hypothetical protein